MRAEEPPYAVGRERVRTRVVRYVREQAERRAGPQSNAWVQKIARARPVGAYVDAVWPKARPEEVVAELLTGPEALAAAADGVLDAEEQKAVLWTRPPRSWKSARWSAADLVLLDEVAGLIEHPQGYGHFVIDEAQDLSPMECRAIARRAAFGSLTVLGDLAQGTTPWAARDWGELLGHLGKPDAAVVPLTIGFRVPEAVVELANRLLAGLDVEVPVGPVPAGDGELRMLATDDVLAETVEAVRRALAYEGSVGVVAADADVVRVREALDAAGIEAAGVDQLGARVSLCWRAGVTKGLEYDHVVAVEPAAIVEAEARGLHRLVRRADPGRLPAGGGACAAVAVRLTPLTARVSPSRRGPVRRSPVPRDPAGPVVAGLAGPSGPVAPAHRVRGSTAPPRMSGGPPARW